MNDGGDELRRALDGNRAAIEAGLRAAHAELEILHARSRQLEELIARGNSALGDTPSIRMTLHEALALVLRENANRWMRAGDLAAEVSRRGLYRKRDGSRLEVNQVHARTNNYPDLFEKKAGQIRLRTKPKPMK
jgi:hypothetical protein